MRAPQTSLASLASKFLEWRKSPLTMVRELFGIEPDPWQKQILEVFPTSPRIAMTACKGPGKANSFSTLVPTPLGNRRWGDLQVGDWLFAEDGTATRIIARHDRGVLPIYRVTFDDGSYARVCGEHLWKVKGRTERRKNLGWSVISTHEIMRRGVREKNGRWAGGQFEIPTQGPISLPAATLPVDPYIVGVSIGGGAAGAPVRPKLDLEIEREVNRRGYATTRRKDGASVIVYPPGTPAVFREVECFAPGVHERFVPDNYKWASIPQRWDLLRGLMDSNGCAGADGHVQYDATSRRLADDVVWLVRSLGGVAFIKNMAKKASCVNEAGERVERKDCYRVTVRAPENPFLLPRKAVLWTSPYANKSTQRCITRYIDSIEPDGFEEAMCVTVEHPTGTYLANDFIVTHNTALLSWIGWNFLLTRPKPKIAATSISGDNLRDNLWTEMAKWRDRSPLLKEKFEWTTKRIFLKEAPEQWFMTARTWPANADVTQQQGTLAGLHADYILFLIDEAGDMTDAVLAAADAALSSPKEGHLVIAGNPTRLSGPLYRAWKNENKLWKVFEITGDPDDPNRSPRVGLDWARDTIREYGATHPYVLVNVFGKFPPASFNALIGPDEVRDAMKRYYRDYQIGTAARIIGCDVARYGDDSSVIVRRHGSQAYPFELYRSINGVTGAGLVLRHINEFSPNAVFIDDTGGFGSSWIDQLKMLGQSPIPVHFASKAYQKDRYENRRAEMYFGLVEWIRSGGALPPDEELVQDLTNTTYSLPRNSLILEPKAMVKAKQGGRSPDKADALALTFAEPVMPVRLDPRGLTTKPYEALHRFDPYALDNKGDGRYSGDIDFSRR